MTNILDNQAIPPFADLPIELIREILDFAAFSCHKTSLNLTLVSPTFRIWILPILYSTVVLRTASAVKSFLHALSFPYTTNSSLLPPVPLTQHVKHLAIFALGPLQSIEKIITSCSNVQTLACGFSLTSYASINPKLPTATIIEIPSQTQIRERHLLGLSCRDSIPFSLLSRDTTHLHAQISSLQVLLSLLQMHKQMPILSHLALRIPSTLLATRHSASLFFKSLQEYNENLRTILVLITDHSEAFFNEWVVAKGMMDSKVVIKQAIGSAVSQWDNESMVGKGSLWAAADAEVERRMKVMEHVA
ncbi:hypothetical protein J3R30DRAFT_3367073 [Lentinula aciculospora]|uniref:Uncharacterized protein n=1 Tax=Lentinula aciculospora TaxID=153920 RepID=A0A9W9ALG5_9AGAR|nr:hypothetical protein J3R30DRAFT_3367073 [Lentinula aciculospora]